MQNYNSNMQFIHKKPKHIKWIFVFYLFLFIGLILYFSVIKIYSKLNCKAIVINNNLVISSSINDINKLVKSKYFKINDKKYTFNVLNYSNIYNNGNINLQDIEISSSYKNKKENQIIDLTFYYDEEKIIKKIVKGVLQ